MSEDLDTILPQETDRQKSEEALMRLLSQESFSNRELEKYIPFIWDMHEKHPTILTALCKKLLISLARERLELYYLKTYACDCQTGCKVRFYKETVKK